MIREMLTQNEKVELEVELFSSALDGALTEQRYDEIMVILLPLADIPDAQATLLLFGKPEWREKHYKLLVAS
jgi:hypothetical protein